MSDFSLIETFGWHADSGFARLDHHLNRLQASSLDLGFAFDREKTLNTLNHTHQSFLSSSENESPQHLRIRLQLEPNGGTDIQYVPFQPVPNTKIYRIALAETRLSSSNSLLQHKTTERRAYQSARDEFPPDEIDEVLLCNEKGELCEGTITNVFMQAESDGPLLTPAIQCGLLPGILRQELLEKNLAREAILTPADLESAKALFVGNSLRGLIKATL